jgi:hypothetical protein
MLLIAQKMDMSRKYIRQTHFRQSFIVDSAGAKIIEGKLAPTLKMLHSAWPHICIILLI